MQARTRPGSSSRKCRHEAQQPTTRPAQWKAVPPLSHHRGVPKFEKGANAMHAESRLMPLSNFITCIPYLHAHGCVCLVRPERHTAPLLHCSKAVVILVYLQTNICQLLDVSSLDAISRPNTSFVPLPKPMTTDRQRQLHNLTGDCWCFPESLKNTTVSRSLETFQPLGSRSHSGFLLCRLITLL